MQKIHKVLLAIGFIILLGMYFIGRPLLHKQEAVKTLVKVLNNWEKGDYTFNYIFWQDHFKVPPINQIDSYDLIDKQFDHKNGSLHASITLKINFPENADLPSGKIWKAELIDTNAGWLIDKFDLEDNDLHG